MMTAAKIKNNKNFPFLKNMNTAISFQFIKDSNPDFMAIWLTKDYSPGETKRTQHLFSK